MEPPVRCLAPRSGRVRGAAPLTRPQGSAARARGPRGAVPTPLALARRLVSGLSPTAPVLDPACGDGALLAACLEASLAAGLAPGAALERLHGIELEPALALRARARLAARTGTGPRFEAGARLRTGDALTGEPWPAGTWVVANPPWGALAGRQSRRLPEALRRRLAGAGSRGWPSLQGPFLVRIARHVAEHRTGARLLVPAALLESPRYAPLRAELARSVRPEGPPEELGERAFPGVTAPAVLLALVPLDAPLEPQAAGRWGSEPPPLVRALAGLPRAPARTFADPGVHTGNQAAALVVRGGPEQPSPAHRPLREGRCLAAHDLGPPRAWIRTDLTPDPERRFRLRARAHYAGFPVLVRQTADRPIAALHAQPTYFRNSLLAARAVEGLDPAFLVAVLNGPVAAAWHRARFRDARQRAFPQVKVGHLAELPLPLPHRDRDPRLHDELAARARALAAGSSGADRERFEREVEALGRRTLGAYRLTPELAAAALEGARPRAQS